MLYKEKRYRHIQSVELSFSAQKVRQPIVYFSSSPRPCMAHWPKSLAHIHHRTEKIPSIRARHTNRQRRPCSRVLHSPHVTQAPTP